MTRKSSNNNNALRILKKYIADQRILRHSLATQYKANYIAQLAHPLLSINLTLVNNGALLHDIGRAQIHDITHGYVGGQILIGEGVSRQVARIVECHVLGGFTAHEARSIGLPCRDFLPHSWEEKIVCIADKLGRYEWSNIGTLSEWIPKMKNRFARLRRRYGVGKVYEKSMMRAVQYAMSLIRLFR